MHIPEKSYRALFEDPTEQVITLSHLFDAITDAGLKDRLDGFLKKNGPLRVLIEGSAFTRNIDVVEQFLKDRNNSDDEIIVVDISEQSVESHSHHIMSSKRVNRVVRRAIQGDMNNLDCQLGQFDLVINDCAINFNDTDQDNKKTLLELRNILLDGGVVLLTVVVDRSYDSEKVGEDQIPVSDDLINQPGDFSSFKTLDDGAIQLISGTERKAWPVAYYENLFKESGFDFVKFDVEQGKSFFPSKSRISYRRYMLTLKKDS